MSYALRKVRRRNAPCAGSCGLLGRIGEHAIYKMHYPFEHDGQAVAEDFKNRFPADFVAEYACPDPGLVLCYAVSQQYCV